MLIIPLIILLILYFMYCLLMRYESRTLWSGVGFFGLSMMTIITAFFYAFYYSETLTYYPLIMDIGGSISRCCSTCYPIFSTCNYYYVLCRRN